MGRKSIADLIIKDLEDFEDSTGPFIIMYDFTRTEGRSIHHSFWRNLNRLFEKLGDGKRLQLSIMQTQYLKTAMAIKVLAEKFKARDVAIYRVERINI